jgi:hypothetical protein
MIILGQFLDVILSSILIVRLFRYGLHLKYKAFLVFVAYDTLQSIIVLIYLGLDVQRFLDYRLLWSGMEITSWITTIWMVYALLIAILKHLPGILRFSLVLLNGVFGLSILIGILTVRPESAAASWARDPDWSVRLSGFVGVLGRALCFAELLAITLTLLFVLFFPIRVPRNLAVFSVGLSIYLFFQIGFQLGRSYVPGFEASRFVEGAPGYIIAACLLYWIFSLNPAGEEASATLGRNWQAVPRDHLVRQLEAMNAALLRSREQS